MPLNLFIFFISDLPHQVIISSHIQKPTLWFLHINAGNKSLILRGDHRNLRSIENVTLDVLAWWEENGTQRREVYAGNPDKQLWQSLKGFYGFIWLGKGPKRMTQIGMERRERSTFFDCKIIAVCNCSKVQTCLRYNLV